MKKDIKIPVVENVYMAVMQEWNDDFMEKTWYAYLINDSDDKLETVIVVSNATGVIDGEERKTSMMRHAFMEVPANSAIKVELLEESVLQLHNSFMVTFFRNNMLFDKNYVFIAGTINEEDTVELPVIAKDGILVK